jgi:hypothetical protein
MLLLVALVIEKMVNVVKMDSRFGQNSRILRKESWRLVRLNRLRSGQYWF